jgi:hypothetical protein
MGLLFWALGGFISIVWKYASYKELGYPLWPMLMSYGFILLLAVGLCWKNLKYVVDKKECRLCSKAWSPEYLSDGLCGKCAIEKRMMDIEEGRTHVHQEAQGST